jgi:putative DNA primase/helicase
MSARPDPVDALAATGVGPTRGGRTRLSGGQSLASREHEAGSAGDTESDGTIADTREVRVLPPPSNPMAVARRLVDERFIDGATVILRAWRGGFRAWDGRCWPERDEASVRAEAYKYLEDAWYEGAHGLRPWEPTRAKVANVLEALRAVVHLPPAVQPPAWLHGEGLDPRDLVVTATGILNVPTRQLLPHDPRLFIGHAVPFAYGAGKLPRWPVEPYDDHEE